MKIAIVGSGIAGLTMRIALRLLGIECEVYERRERLSAAGGALGIGSNALRVFEYLGIRRQLDPYACPIADAYVANEKIEKLRDFPRAAFGVAIPRSRLLDLLLEAAGAEGVHFNRKFVDFEHLANGQVRLKFEEGPDVTADVLIAADGLRSRVRQKVAPHIQLRYSGQAYFAGFSSYELPHEQRNTFTELWGLGLKFGIVPLRQGVYWFASKKAACTEEYDEASHKNTVAQLFQGFAEPVGSVIRNAHGIFYSHMYDIPPINSAWHDRSVCLIGDAAHATTPNLAQGACQAIEDAYVLAQLISQSPAAESMPSVFERFRELRQDKVKLVVEMSWSSGKAAHYDTALSIGLRNIVLRTLPRRITDKRMQAIVDVTYLDDVVSQHRREVVPAF